MLSDEEKKDILFQIDMQLYDEFNDKFCEMNDNLGTVYSYKDLDDLEKLEKETEIKLLRQAIEKQSKEIEELKKDKLELINKNHVVHLKDVEKELREMKKVIDTKNAEIECLNVIHESYKENNFISKDKIKAKIEEIKNECKYCDFTDEFCEELLENNNCTQGNTLKVLQSLLEEE